MHQSTLSLHQQAVYPMVRVRSKRAGGSGTIIYSAPLNPTEYETLVLTNHHVIEDAIEVKKRWDAYLSRDVKEETRALVSVEAFRYNFLSRNVGVQSSQAEIVAYDEVQDMALLRLLDVQVRAEHVARLYPRGEAAMREVYIGDAVYACGCSLGHPPILTTGIITSMNDIIENYEYWMSSAQTIYGSSGGAIFRGSERGLEFLGIPSRIAVIGIGFMGTDAITHMGYFIPIHRVYSFLEEQLFQYVFDSKFTSAQCAEMRRQRKEHAEKSMEALRRGLIPDENEEA